MRSQAQAQSFDHSKAGSRAGFVALAALLFWAPFPLASNRPLPIGILAIGLALTLFWVALGDALTGRSPLRRLKRGWLPLACMILMALLIMMQRLDFGGGPIALDAHFSLQYLWLTVTYVCAFVLVLLVVNTPERARMLAYVLVASGVVQALAAILLYALRAKYAVFYYEMDHTAYARGMFSYRNSLANYLLITMFVGLGLLLAHVDQVKDRTQNWRSSAAKIVRFIFSGAMRIRLMLLVMVIALVMTRSRMGNAAFVITVVMVALPVLYATGRLKKGPLMLIASILAIDIAIVGNLVGVERVMDRLQQTPIIQQAGHEQESLQTRALPGSQSLAMIAERPWLGFGAGSFYAAFPRFAAPEHTLMVDYAHNDYAQLAVETGLIGFGLLALAVVAVIWRVLRVMRRPASQLDWGLAFGVVLAVAAVLIQAGVDFHFHITANALTFVSLMALACTLRERGQIGENATNTCREIRP